MRLIDADALCKECIDELILTSCDGCVVRDYKLHKAIDAAHVVHGRWLRRGRNLGECSNCGEIVATRYNYCPNCGAKMDMGADGE